MFLNSASRPCKGGGVTGLRLLQRNPIRMHSSSKGTPLRSKKTASGHRGLTMNEKLIFEQAVPGVSGVDFPSFTVSDLRVGDASKSPGKKIGWPGLSEGAAMRHYVLLSQKNFCIDSGLYPLGSCTMKYNPRLNEKVARLPGLSDVHPLQPPSTVQGALQCMYLMGQWLCRLTGMTNVALSPAAGAHGELCGMMAIAKAIEVRGEKETRKIVLVPTAAHGTNPSTAYQIGFDIEIVPTKADGRVNLSALQNILDEKGPQIAAIMLTNPNTHGLFEREIIGIAEAIREAGGYFYCDGANFNALLGRVKVSDLGVDCMHINLHKTFSTPHGGGGPGSGPVVFNERLAPYAPLPHVINDHGRYRLIEFPEEGQENTIGKLRAHAGQMGMWIRALAFSMAHGVDGLRQSSGDAVLNANYLLARLRHLMTPAFSPRRCMHEVLFHDAYLAKTGVTTMDMAKSLIDEGFHPPTVYWPLTVQGAMLMEPTENESIHTLDRFVETLESLVEKAKSGEHVQEFQEAPIFTPIRRADEALAAKKPILRWTPPQEPAAPAAE